MMIEAAIEACSRRRKLVYKFYEAKEQLEGQASAAYQGEDRVLKEQHVEKTKKIEDFQERVQESNRVLETELKLFKDEKEGELRFILSEFVRLQKATNEKLKNQWGLFLQRAEAKDPQAMQFQSQHSLDNSMRSL